MWRVALALLLVFASLLMFTSPPWEPLIERFTDEACNAPVAQDVPFLSRQQTGDHNPSNSKKWSEPPPRLTWDRRVVDELHALEPCTVEVCRPSSAPRQHASARGPPA